jgi:hypothetical protein
MDRRFYIYAYYDGDEPFYIGKGTGGRARSHMGAKLLMRSDTFFYQKLRKLLDAGKRPTVDIIKDALTEQEAYDGESELIYLVGMRTYDTGPLCNTTIEHPDFNISEGRIVEVWGEVFPSMTALAADPRCKVGRVTLSQRLKAGLTPEEAASDLTPTIPCWGEDFASFKDIASDDRCLVSDGRLRARLGEGWDIEKAASTPGKCAVFAWGEHFPDIPTLARDERCVVHERRLRKRICYKKWSPEEAASTPLHQKRNTLPT